MSEAESAVLGGSKSITCPPWAPIGYGSSYSEAAAGILIVRDSIREVVNVLCRGKEVWRKKSIGDHQSGR